MDGKATIEKKDVTAKLTAGHAPMRLGGTGTATFYLINCEHGTTQLHEVEGVDPTVVTANLIAEHNRKLECKCQPS